jgi:hypothetical protein
VIRSVTLVCTALANQNNRSCNGGVWAGLRMCTTVLTPTDLEKVLICFPHYVSLVLTHLTHLVRLYVKNTGLKIIERELHDR